MANKANRRWRRRSASRPRRAAPIDGPINLVFGFDGEPVSSCSCPVCAKLAASGVPTYTTDRDGNLIEVAPTAPPAMMEVSVRGDATTSPYLPTTPQPLSIPVGCVAIDLIGFLQFESRELAINFAPGGLTAAIAGEPCEPNRVLRRGDELVISGAPDPRWRELMERTLAPPG